MLAHAARSQTTPQKPFSLLLEKWRLLKGVVGAPRFELGTSWSRTKRATRLRYAPKYREKGSGTKQKPCQGPVLLIPKS